MGGIYPVEAPHEMYPTSEGVEKNNEPEDEEKNIGEADLVDSLMKEVDAVLDDIKELTSIEGDEENIGIDEAVAALKKKAYVLLEQIKKWTSIGIFPSPAPFGLYPTDSPFVGISPVEAPHGMYPTSEGAEKNNGA